MGSSEVRIQGADRLELAENNRTEARGTVDSIGALVGVSASPQFHGGLKHRA